MSYQPLQEGTISTALFGIADPAKFTDPIRLDVDQSLFKREIHSPEEKQNSIKYTIIIVFISAIIFVTVIAIYDVFKSLITNYFARDALQDPNSHNKREDIERTIISNQDALKSNFWFALFCIITAIILISILIKLL